MGDLLSGIPSIICVPALIYAAVMTARRRGKRDVVRHNMLATFAVHLLIGGIVATALLIAGLYLAEWSAR